MSHEALRGDPVGNATPRLTHAAEEAVRSLGARFRVDTRSVRTLLDAVVRGGGTMAQFDCAELGGHGQWMRGGMTLLAGGDDAEREKVSALCGELSALYERELIYEPPPSDAGTWRADPAMHARWYPDELGTPSASGGQNGMHYALFPEKRRIAIDCVGSIDVYDTGEHDVHGVSQSADGDACDLCFTSQLGTFPLSRLRRVQGTKPE